VKGLILFQKGSSSVTPFLPIFCHLSHHQRVVLTRGDFISLFFSQALPSHGFLPSHYISSWILTLINKTARCRHHSTKSNGVLFTQLIKCIFVLILRIGRSFVLSGDELSVLPFGCCSANSFLHGNSASPAGSCLVFQCSGHFFHRRSNQ